MRAADFAYFDAPTPIGLAHRGGAKIAANLHLENTLPAFRRGRADGLPLPRDRCPRHGRRHAARLPRPAARPGHRPRGRIADLPYAAVRRARINGTEPIPLLSDLLEEFPDTRINIDVKAPGAIEPLAEVIRGTGRSTGCASGRSPTGGCGRSAPLLGPGLATAAGPTEVAALLRFAPGGRPRGCAPPRPSCRSRPATSRGRSRLDLVTPGPGASASTRSASTSTSGHRSRDDAPEMHRLFDLGVDGIVSDRIDTLADVLAERGIPLSQCDRAPLGRPARGDGVRRRPKAARVPTARGCDAASGAVGVFQPGLPATSRSPWRSWRSSPSSRSRAWPSRPRCPTSRASSTRCVPTASPSRSCSPRSCSGSCSPASGATGPARCRPCSPVSCSSAWAAALCGAAGFGPFLAGRGVAGLGAGLIIVAAYVVIGRAYPE